MLENAAQLLPRRRWWAALGMIVLLAAALRLTGYNFSLPYIDHPDEPSYLIAARMVIDNGSPKPLGMQGYPPGIIAVNYLLLRFFQDPEQHPTSLLFVTRLISIGFSLGVVVVIGLLAYRGSTPLAGLIAALIWSISPHIVEYSRYATPDNFVTFFALLALFLTLTGTRFDRRGWIYGGVIAVMTAIVFKYQAVLILPLILFVPLHRLWTPGASRSIIRDEFGRTMLLIGAFGIWLIFLFPALEAGQSPNWSAPTSRLGIPSPFVVLNNLLMILQPIARTPLWALGMVACVLPLWHRLRNNVRGFDAAVIALAALMWVTGGSLYGTLDSSEFRQFITVAALLVILVGVGLSNLTGLVVTLGRGIPRRALVGSLLVMVMILNLGDLQVAVSNARRHSLPDQRNLLTQWADIALPPGGYIAQNENHKVFNPDWGGFSGQHAYPLVEIAALSERAIEEWRSLDTQYALVPYEDYPQLPDSLVAQTLRLRTFPPDDAILTGPAMVVLRLYPMQQTRALSLGTVMLVGCDLSAETVAAGDSLRVAHYWRAAQALIGDYRVFNHVINEDGILVAQADGHPTFDVRRTTENWDNPDEIIIGQTFTLALPETLPPGSYRLISGFYRADTGERLSDSGTDSISVATITVSP